MIFAESEGIEDGDGAEPRFHADGEDLFALAEAARADDDDDRGDEVEDEKAAVVDGEAHGEDDREECGGEKGCARREEDADQNRGKGSDDRIADRFDDAGGALQEGYIRSIWRRGE